MGGSSGATTAGAGGTAGSAAGGMGGSGGAVVVGTCTPVKPDDIYSPIMMLSQTGCVDPTDPRKPIAKAVSYEVNSPLWSDSANKVRAFVLPAGKKIHIRKCSVQGDCPGGAADEGRWDFPVGTVMIKIFMFDAKLVETRLFMHMGDDTGADAGWIGYGYQWDETQKDATVVGSDRADAMFSTSTGMVDWHYPSRKDCMTCHNVAAGSTLGPETAQMNRVVGGMNQMDKFQALGLFDAAPAQPYKAALVAPYAGQAGTPPASATATQKARSYLHANCAFCHRPDGDFNHFDLRYDTAFTDTKLCNVDGLQGAIGGNPSIKLLSPGKSADSLMYERMNTTTMEAGRMPQIGTFAIDMGGTPLVKTWIDSISTGCVQPQ